MTEMTEPVQKRLWTPEGFIDDEWTMLAGEVAISASGKFIVPLAGYLALSQAERESGAGRLGVLISPSDDLESIAPHLSAIALVALSYPAFSDGRAYSKSVLLKSRCNFAGTLRATGDVLIDQVELMLRVGFDELEISNPATIARLERGRPGGVALHYQPAQRAEIHSNHYSWRRRPAA